MNIINIHFPFFDNQENENLIIGHFDVFHKGHLNLISNNMSNSFLIFDNNPSKKENIYSLEERIQNLLKLNPKNIYVFDISKNNLNAQDFIDMILSKIKFKKISIGEDFVFGKNRKGSAKDLKDIFENVSIIKKGKISTTNIKDFLKKGLIEKANELLITNYYYKNEVIKGKQLARQLFKPTANIVDNKNIIIPFGSYASITKYKNNLYKSICFIGIPKTFETDKRIVESHIFDFDKNIYSEIIEVYPLKFIRENEKFNDISELKKAILKDYEYSIEYFNGFDIKKFNY